MKKKALDPLRLLRDLQSEADALRRELAETEPKRKRLAMIETQLREAASILRGDVAVKPKSRHGFTGGKRAKPIQRGSSVWWAQKVLYLVGQPLHITKLLDRIKKESGETFKKATLVSNLSRYVKYGDTFNRPAPNVFGLVDFNNDPDQLFDLPWAEEEEEQEEEPKK